MPPIRSLTAALVLALVIPFAGAHAADDCTEAVSIQSTSKGDKITTATDSKNPVGKHLASLPGDAAVAAKQPAQAKIGRDLGKPQTAVPSTGKKTTWPKAFQKRKGNCC